MSPKQLKINIYLNYLILKEPAAPDSLVKLVQFAWQQA